MIYRVKADYGEERREERRERGPAKFVLVLVKGKQRGRNARDREAFLRLCRADDSHFLSRFSSRLLESFSILPHLPRFPPLALRGPPVHKEMKDVYKLREMFLRRCTDRFFRVTTVTGNVLLVLLKLRVAKDVFLRLSSSSCSACTLS